MPTFEELDKLSSRELHDRAISLARKRLDVGFFWKLVQEIPAAEAAAGDIAEAESDVIHTYLGQIHDAMHASEGKLADALRPLYIEYLLEHG
ncbi:MAG: hypothetical protein M3Q23_09320 [Actinomycetota bacterium]|nr:hypothetical protein [Actinomycetota bacterium]